MTTPAVPASSTSASPRPATPEPCRYLKAGECGNRLALPVYGKRPSDAVCRRCEHRNGLRGLGDALAWLLSWTPACRLQAPKVAAGQPAGRACGGCKERQEALNQMVPNPFKSP